MTVTSPDRRTGSPGDELPARGVTQRVLPASPVLWALTGVALVNTFGNGLFYTSALFFTRSVGMAPARLGLAIAGVCGVAAGPPLGWLAGHSDARRVLMAALAWASWRGCGHTETTARGGSGRHESGLRLGSRP